MLSKSDNLKYQLNTLATYEPKDLDYPEFDVACETVDGHKDFVTVSCIDIAKRTLDRIKQLELDLGLMTASAEHNAMLLNSCEKALEKAQFQSEEEYQRNIRYE